MELRTVDENNIEEYSHIVDMDVAENIGRVFYHGLAGHDPYDDSILSLLIWELKSKDSDENPESELKLIYSIDPSYISPLMDGYGSEAADDCAKLPPGKKAGSLLRGESWDPEQHRILSGPYEHTLQITICTADLTASIRRPAFSTGVICLYL